MFLFYIYIYYYSVRKHKFMFIESNQCPNTFKWQCMYTW